MMSKHEEGFYNVLCQAFYLFNINGEDVRYHIDKDVQNGVLMAIEDLPCVHLLGHEVDSPPNEPKELLSSPDI